MTATLYQNPRQASGRDPSAWENEFGDVIEAAFAAGVRDLDALVEALGTSRVRPREGGEWTAERLTRTLAELGA